MKVIHVITTLDIGGAEKQLSQLVRIQKQNSLICEVWYLKGNAPLRAELEQSDIKVRKLTIGFFFREGIKYRRRKETGLKAKKLLVHAHLPRSELVSLCFSLISGLPLVVSKHNTEPMWPRGNKQMSRILAKLVYSRASGVICISRAVKNYLEKSHELPAKSEKVSVIYYGFADRQENSIKKPKNSLKVLTLARLEPQKDLITLILASQILQNHGMDVKVRIRGAGRLKNILENEISQRNLNNIEILPPIENVSSEYDWADILVLPSKYEGFGLVLLEAMQKKIMILAANSTAVEEVLNSREALLFDVGDYAQLASKLARLVTSEEERLENRKLVQEVSKLFDIRNQLKWTGIVYERAFQ